MQVVRKNSPLWLYLSIHLQDLIKDGEQLLTYSKNMKGVSDYSFLVFPFSKAYEGFLKKIFLDLKLINEDNYYSDDLRIGRILNPHYIKSEESVYEKLSYHEKGGGDISRNLWELWKKGRNRIFHYFPNNYTKLNYDEALKIIKELVKAMNEAVERCGVAKNNLLEKIETLV